MDHPRLRGKDMFCPIGAHLDKGITPAYAGKTDGNTKII